MKLPTARITIELEFEYTQLTLAELRLAVEQTLNSFIEQNVDFVSLVDPTNGNVLGAHLEGYKVTEGPRG
jgi:hypothetical protein